MLDSWLVASLVPTYGTSGDQCESMNIWGEQDWQSLKLMFRPVSSVGGKTKWIRESVSTCAGLQLPLLVIIFCFLLVYFVLCPDHSPGCKFQVVFCGITQVLLSEWCFFFVRWSKGVLYCNHMFCTYTSSYTFLSLCCPCLSSQF